MVLGFLLANKHRKAHISVASQLLDRNAVKGDILLNIVAGSKSFFHDFGLKTGEQSMEWHHIISNKEEDEEE
jgi:hypothetical protein